jgi:hypothetical protein
MTDYLSEYYALVKIASLKPPFHRRVKKLYIMNDSNGGGNGANESRVNQY